MGTSKITLDTAAIRLTDLNTKIIPGKHAMFALNEISTELFKTCKNAFK
jgi:hypothetical protein